MSRKSTILEAILSGNTSILTHPLYEKHVKNWTTPPNLLILALKINHVLRRRKVFNQLLRMGANPNSRDTEGAFINNTTTTRMIDRYNRYEAVYSAPVTFRNRCSLMRNSRSSCTGILSKDYRIESDNILPNKIQNEIEKNLLNDYIEADMTVFGWACRLQRIDQASYLLSKRLADIDVFTTDRWNGTPLHYAVSNNNYILTKLLVDYALKYAINIDMSDSMGNTPLLLARKNSFKEIEELLINYGGASKCQENGIEFEMLHEVEKKFKLEKSLTNNNFMDGFPGIYSLELQLKTERVMERNAIIDQIESNTSDSKMTFATTAQMTSRKPPKYQGKESTIEPTCASQIDTSKSNLDISVKDEPDIPLKEILKKIENNLSSTGLIRRKKSLLNEIYSTGTNSNKLRINKFDSELILWILEVIGAGYSRGEIVDEMRNYLVDKQLSLQKKKEEEDAIMSSINYNQSALSSGSSTIRVESSETKRQMAECQHKMDSFRNELINFIMLYKNALHYHQQLKKPRSRKSRSYHKNMIFDFSKYLKTKKQVEDFLSIIGDYMTGHQFSSLFPCTKLKAKPKEQVHSLFKLKSDMETKSYFPATPEDNYSSKISIRSMISQCQRSRTSDRRRKDRSSTTGGVKSRYSSATSMMFTHSKGPLPSDRRQSTMVKI
ncbi:hypothetical protein SNEBB_008713 [Seison nebaliae]|nr:hypothetical protein SNEBB_008713 [Seison nebaliae]